MKRAATKAESTLTQKSRAVAQSPAATPFAHQARRLSPTTWLSLASAVLLAAAFPPLDWWPLAWIAPVGWLLLCRQERLDGWRPYRTIYLSGFVFWMLALHWIRLPHPANYLGWVALSAYLAFYVPAFVGLVRVAVHRWRFSVVIAAPVVWTGLELVRGHLLTGFTMGSLGYTQYRWIPLIQVADFAGAYGVSFVVMCGAACIARVLPVPGENMANSSAVGDRGYRRRLAAWPIGLLALVLAATLGYGYWRLGQSTGRPGPRIALIQGSTDTEIKSDPTKNRQVFEEYADLSVRAVREADGIDLMIWPETMFRDSLIEYDPKTVSPPPGAKWNVEMLADAAAYVRETLDDMARGLKVPLLLGIDTHIYGPGTVTTYNSALAISPDGKLGARYDKMHPVMFGEYIPLANRFPILYQIMPIKSSLTPGTKDVVFRAGDSRLAANICFESVLPHLIRGQVARLRARGEEPDVLANLTNDGWFWGSSELDMHLVCGVFRAVECRKPLVIAANTGFSADIDSSGRIRQQGPRRAQDVLIADVLLDSRQSPYSVVGDLFAGVCLVAVSLLAGGSIVSGWRARRAKALVPSL